MSIQTAPLRLRDRQPLGLQEVKDQARRLREQLARHELQLGNNQALEMMARIHGFDAWGELKAQLTQQDEPAPAVHAARAQISDRISGLTPNECIRRLHHALHRQRQGEMGQWNDEVHRQRLPAFAVMSGDLLGHMLLHGNTDGPLPVDRRTVTNIDKATLIERLHLSRSSAKASWRDRGQDRLIEIVRDTDFDALILPEAASAESPSAYLKPVLDVPEGGFKTDNNVGWKYSYADVGSHFDNIDCHIAVISRNEVPGELASRLVYDIADRDPRGSHAVGISHDGRWSSSELKPAIEERVKDGSPQRYEDYADKVDYALAHLTHRDTRRASKPLILSLPWRPLDVRYLQLLQRASDLNVQVILDITAAHYSDLERADLMNILHFCDAQILGEKALFPQHPDKMPVYNDSGVPAVRWTERAAS